MLDIGASRPLPPGELEYRATRSERPRRPAREHLLDPSRAGLRPRGQPDADRCRARTGAAAAGLAPRRRGAAAGGRPGRAQPVPQPPPGHRAVLRAHALGARTAAAPAPAEPADPGGQGGAARGQAPRRGPQAAAAAAGRRRRPGRRCAVRLEGKTVLVTGGGSGIGAAIVRRFAAEGATVWAMGRRREQLERVSERVVAGDVGEPADRRRAIEATGPLDVLVNNAGIGEGELGRDARGQPDRRPRALRARRRRPGAAARGDRERGVGGGARRRARASRSMRSPRRAS